MKFDEWTTLTINDVCTVTDCQHKTAPTVAEKSRFRMLRTTNIRNGKLVEIETTKSVTEDIYHKWSVRGYLESGDVILTREAPMGEVALLKEGKYKFFLGQRLLQLKANKEKITPEFLYYSLQTPFLRYQIMMNEGTGSVVSNIRIPVLKNMKISVVPLSVQKQITNILSSLDEKIEINNQINKKLEEMAQTIFKQWFVDFEFPNEEGKPYKSSGGAMVESELGMIPEGWEVGSVTEQFSVNSGGTPNTKINEYWNGEIPFFTPKDCSSALFILDTEKNITDLGLSKCNSKLYKKGTVFITARGTVGNVAVSGREMAMNQSCYALIPHEGYSNSYIYYVTTQLVRKLKMNASGSVFDAITVSTFSNLKTVIPLKSIIGNFDRIIQKIHSLILNNTKENKYLSQVRDNLLPKLMSGEIRIPIDKE